MFKLTQYRRLAVDSLFKGYANGLITGEELDYMIDLAWGQLVSEDVEF